MQKALALKILAVVLVIWLLLNMVLFALGKLSAFVFWIALGIFALIAYKGIPMLQAQRKL